MSRIKTHVKKGDQVEVISGGQKGKQGTILKVDAEKGHVIIDGIRPQKKAIRPTEENREGGYKTINGPVHISNVKKLG